MSIVALITGANRGIGKAIAIGLASQNKHVLLGCRNLKDGQSAASQIDGKVTPVELDLSTSESRKRGLTEILEDNPKIDILVNNAGVLESGNLIEVGEQEFKHSFEVNFMAPFELTKAIAPIMIRNNYGRIVNVSSGWGSFEEGLTGPAAYSVSKASLNALTLSLAQALPDTVKVNSMCPGWVRTRMGGKDANRSPAKGAETAIWLANLDEDGPSGEFFRDKKIIDW